MKIATWNVNGIRARQAQFCEWVAREQPDVVCLQELKAEPSQIPEPCKIADYATFWHGMRAYSGVSLHIRRALFKDELFFSHPSFDMEARIVQAEIGNLVVASVYVPNGGKDYAAKIEFIQALVRWSQKLTRERREIVLCGDLNVTRAEMDVHPKERDPGLIGQRAEERELFAALLENLVDVGRQLQPANADMFTWWAPWRNMRQRNIGWRIDYVLASPAIAARAASCTVLADVGTSDHAPVMMTTA